MYGVVINIQRQLIALAVVAGDARLRIHAVLPLARIAEIQITAVARHYIRYLPAVSLHGARISLVKMSVPGKHNVRPHIGGDAGLVDLRQHARAWEMRFAD